VICLYRVHQTNIQRTTGQQKRLNDLVYRRMKVLNSDWFAALSLPTRKQFLLDFLTTVLIDQPVQQQSILEHQHVRDLPASDQATLWRQVGTQYLLKRSESEFAIRCLQQSAQLQPTDRKSALTLLALRTGGINAAYAMLRSWQIAHNLIRRVRSIGRTTPKPVPLSTQPTSK
jgi:hypothetical protein